MHEIELTETWIYNTASMNWQTVTGQGWKIALKKPKWSLGTVENHGKKW